MISVETRVVLKLGIDAPG